MTGYYVNRDGKIAGPLTQEQIKAGLAEARIRDDDLIGLSDSGPWRKIGDYQSGPAADAPQTVDPLPVTSGTKQCPFCAETIASAAIKCKHCGSMLPDRAAAAPGIKLPAMDVSRWRDNTVAWFEKYRVILEYIAVWLLWPAYAFFTIGSLVDGFVFQRGSQLSLLAAVVSLVAAFGVSFWCRSQANRQHHDFLVTSVWNLMLCLLVGLMGVFLITEVIGFRTYDEELLALTFLMAGPIGAYLSGTSGTRVRTAILQFYGLRGAFKKNHLIRAVGTLVVCWTLVYVGQSVKRSMDYDTCVQIVQEHLEAYLELRKSIVKLDVDVRDVSRFSNEMNQATSVGGFGATQRLNAVASAAERDRQRVQSGKERLNTQIEQALDLQTRLRSASWYTLPKSRRSEQVPGYEFDWTGLKLILDDDQGEFLSMRSKHRLYNLK